MTVGFFMIVGISVDAFVKDQSKKFQTKNATNQIANETKASPKVVTKSSVPKKIEWADVNQSVRQGNIRVRVKKVSVDQMLSKNKLLVIALEIENLSPTKIADYKGWGTKLLDFSDQERASLTDDADNNYKRVHFGFGEVQGQVTQNESIYPNKRIGDIVIFEPPTDSCQYVLLQLPASVFGGQGMFRIKIPRSSWE